MLGAMEVAACTTAVVSGGATPDGRPLLWKHRDTWAVKNSVVQLFDGKYSCAGLVNSVDSTNKSIWIGYNETGFGIMNSASYNLNNDTIEQSGLEGRLMKRALQECASVDEFEALLAGLDQPVKLEANFGVIDGQGNAAYFELGNFSYTKFDANDPEVAPDGYIVRTNYSFSGSHGEGGGYVRYLTASRVFREAYEMNDLTYRTIIQKVTRNLTHGLTHTDLTRYVVYPEDTETMVFFKDYIPRSGTSSSCVIQGVKPGESADLSTMWSVVGFPLTSVVTPIWLNKEVELPAVVTCSKPLKDSPISHASLQLKDEVYSWKQGSHADYYIDINRLLNATGTGYMQLLAPLEDQIIQETEQLYEKWRSAGAVDHKALQKHYAWMDMVIRKSYIEHFDLEL